MSAWLIRPPGTLSASDVIAEGVSVGLRIWSRTFVITLLLSAVIPLVVVLSGDSVSLRDMVEWIRDGGQGVPPQQTPLAQLLGLVQGWVLAPILAVLQARFGVGGTLRGHHLTTSDLGRWGLNRWPRAAWLLGVHAIAWGGIAIVAALVILLGFAIDRSVGVGFAVLATLGAIYLAARWSLAYQTLVLEDVRGFKTLARSWELTHDRAWRIVGLLALAGVLALSVTLVGLAAQLLIPGEGIAADAIRSVAPIVLIAAMAPFWIGVLAVLNVDLLARRRGSLGADEADLLLRRADLG
jgi:hypothetical protein